jgi:hypothetical protein
MSVQSPTSGVSADGRTVTAERHEHLGTGWILFAGVMLMIVGILNFSRAEAA